MNNTTHWNIIISDFVNKNQFIDTVLTGEMTDELSEYNTIKGLLFSDITIQQFIEKEDQYDICEAASPELNRKLRTFSAGEQKKEFLNYCLKQKPDFLILDNPFDHLDHASRISLAVALEKLSHSIGLIQLVNRTEDCLDFIPNKVKILDDSFTLNPIEADSKKLTKTIENQIPKALHSYNFPNEELVKMNGVFVSYNERPIVESINWIIKQGEFWQLIGPNGSGKSTLLSMITGENPKGYGQELYLFGRKKGSGESVWDIKKNIGVFSTSMTQLFKRNQTLEEMILSGFFDSIGLYTLPTQLHRQIVAQWLKALNLSALKNKSFNQLSLGLQRVTLIVRAVLKHPPLIILDEPLEGLDDSNSALVIDLINLLIQETKMTVIYVSHRIEPALKPTSIYELIPSETGSTGKIKEIKN
ncbi:ATP-binding cassette domain-containing protein [Flavobacterium cellulosilyticum]|uniref:ATP-binding cassette domain-containing protein n=1 Tax=Flavobacterium cellulosilyticum TaxID=2541731 RepID=A0A4R5CDI5_9FLAO|nr:ATP-binding cassette domain-containing protein [Flavobacterium cellulosilyticum]TDD95234.1 ATP-binding cassette domain-containing protein [Flavobacterium cellulosilyticum]